jgi:hypothetical protein
MSSQMVSLKSSNHATLEGMTVAALKFPSLMLCRRLGNKSLKGGYKLNEIAHKNLFCSFGHGFHRDSSCFQQLIVPFNIFSLFFVFSLKVSLRAADHFTNRIQREF